MKWNTDIILEATMRGTKSRKKLSKYYCVKVHYSSQEVKMAYISNSQHIFIT